MTIAKFINEVGFKVREGDVKKVNGTISNIKNTAAKLLGAIGIGFSLTQINALVEEFGRVNEQVKNSTAALGDQAEIQKKIMESARQTRSSYAETAGVISDLVHESPDLFGNIDEAVKFNNAATMLFKSAGKTNEDIAGLMEAINKSFAKGYVDSETISQLLERSPEAVELLNKKLGTTSDKLEEMASSRTMTVADLKAAFVDNASIIEQKFGGVQYRITDALTVIRSEWGLWLTQMDSTLGVTNTIATAMVKFSDTAMRVMNRVRNAVQWLSDKLGGSEKLLKLLTITVGAFLIASKADKVIGFLKNAGSLLGKLKTGLGAINLKVVAIAAAIIILALLIEDFVNFMQGNDSLLGSLLERAGVDVDKFRANIIKIWENIKTILTAVWKGIKNVAIPIFQGIWSVIKTVFEAIGKIIDKIAPQFANLADQLANGNIDTDKWVKVGEAIAKIIAVIIGVVAAVKTVIAVVRTVTSVVKGVSAVISFVSSPVGLVILAIMALIAVGILLYKNWDKIKAFAIRIWTAIKDFFVNIFTSIGNFFTSIWEGISTFFSSVWNGIKETVSGAVSAVWETISTVFSTIWEFISGVATNIWTAITTAFTNILSGITGTIGNIKDSIVTGFTAAIDWIKSLPAQALQWGADIINNIVEGIKGAVGKVGEAVSGVASKIKGFLGFSEPDEGPLSDFHTYMPDMIDLMTKGISAGKAKVRDALGALTGDMSIMAQANVASPTTARTAMGSNSVSKSVVQNVNINNKFEGDRAGQQKSAAAMDKAAGDSTGEMARALAYAR